MEDKRIAAQKRAAEYNRKMIGQMYRHFKGDFYRVLFVAVHSETAELLVIYCKYPANTPAFSKEGFFFSCPMAFCAFRYVCHFSVAALCAACIRAMLSGFLNISHRREWMSRSLWTRSRVFRAACSVREQINALQISGRTG